MKLKIGDRVSINGYVDEIRKDTIIIRNEGGYFGTVESEVTPFFEGHGRLIDADMLAEKICGDKCGRYPAKCGCDVLCDEMLRVIYAPTVTESNEGGE